MRNERLIQDAVARGLAPPGARLQRLSTQGLSGEVFALEWPGERLLLKLYGRGGYATARREGCVYGALAALGVPAPLAYGFGVLGSGWATRPYLLAEHLPGTGLGPLLERGQGNEFAHALAATLHALHAAEPDDLGGILPTRDLKREVAELKVFAVLFLGAAGAPCLLCRLLQALSQVGRQVPSSARLALLHGDCAPDNVLYHEGTAYLLDMESAYIGSPSFDVAYARLFLGSEPWGSPAIAQTFLDAYLSLTGALPDLEAYTRLAAVKLAVFLVLLTRPNLLWLLAGRAKWGGMISQRAALKAFLAHCLASV